MKSRFRSPLVILLILGLVVAVLAWMVSIVLNRSGDPSAQMTQAITPELVSKGAYLARVGDCVACHTSHEGKAFTGGLGIESPLVRSIPPTLRQKRAPASVDGVMAS